MHTRKLNSRFYSNSERVYEITNHEIKVRFYKIYKIHIYAYNIAKIIEKKNM